MKRIIALFITLLMVFSLAACTGNKLDTQYGEGQLVFEETEPTDEATSTEDSEPTAELTSEPTTTPEPKEPLDPIVGVWEVDHALVNDVKYSMDELKSMLSESAYKSIDLGFIFTEKQVTIFVDGEDSGTTGYKKSADKDNEYVDEQDALTFVLNEDGTMSITQASTVIVFTKTTGEKPVETNIDVTDSTSETTAEPKTESTSTGE